ncbi:MAG: hypothetical protein J7L34_03905 [Thermotogaceae bacterium]|nr:hypothetical protein [Thermotogaceae bacterium]
MKKIILSAIILLSAFLMAKPYIQFSFSGTGDLSDLAKGYTISSVTDSERFYIYFSEAFKVIFKEVKFQDFFTSENILSGNFKEAEYRLILNVNDFSLNYFKKKKEYLKDNENGDYILINGNYIRVYVGEWYRYDYEKDRYILDKKNGRYVKSIDGKYYYYFGDFYRRIPVEETWARMKIDVDYELYDGKEEIINGTFKKGVEKRLVYYTYDELNRKIVRHFENEKLWMSDIAEELSKKVLNDLKKEFVIEANLIDYKDVVVIIDKGREEGVKPEMAFESKGNIFVVREVTQNTSEAEIVKYSSVPIREVKSLREDQNFRYPSLFHIGAGYSNLSGVYLLLGLRSIDLSWREKSYGGVLVSYDLLGNEVKYGVDFRMKLYKGFFAGFSTSKDYSMFYGGISVFNFNPYIGLSDKGFVFGGDLSW